MVDKIFVAAPLFSQAERDFNESLAKKLREAGFEVYLAQEAPFIKEGTTEEKKQIFNGDISALDNCDVVVAVLDGIDIEAGVGFELGYAYANKKPIVGLKTDYRTFSMIEEINLMLAVPISIICKSVEEVIEELKK